MTFSPDDLLKLSSSILRFSCNPRGGDLRCSLVDSPKILVAVVTKLVAT